MAMTYKRCVADKFVLNKTVSASGVIGSTTYDISVEDIIKVVIASAGASNVVTVKGRIFKAPFETITTITGNTTGTSVDVSIYDEVQFDCTTYDSAAFTIKASGFIVI